MTKTKSTKRALLSSALALLICVSMLIGSTFAWFTDSVTSGNNIIKSGNLDIELEYWNGTTWTDVKGASGILTNSLWEPGVTEVAYLRVANAGSLVLKYQLGINILNEIAGKNQTGETFKLSDYIQFGVVEGVNGETGAYTKDDAGRATAIAAVTDAKKISAGYTKASTMNPNDELYLALVVYMPTTVGNEANHNGTDVPQIDLGINVYAAQMTAENDSFDNQYDKDAEYAVSVSTAAELANALAKGGNIVLTNDIEVDECLDILNQNVTLNLNGKKITVADGKNPEYIFNIENKEDGEKTVTIKNGTLEAGVDAVQRTIYAYSRNDAVEGEKLVLNLENVTVKNIRTDGIKNVVHAQRNVTVNVKSGTVLESNGTYGTVEMGYGAVMNVYEGATIKHTSGTSTNAVNGALTAGMYGGVINVYGGTVISDVYSVYALPTGGTINLEGGNYTGNVMAHDAGVVNISGGTYNDKLETNNGTISVIGGTFDADPTAWVAEGYEVVKSNGNYTVQLDVAVGTEIKNELNDATTTTVVAGEDIDLSKSEYQNGGINTLTIKDGKTLDLNNHNISRPTNGSGNGVAIPGNATVTVKNGSITNESDNTGIDISSGATATFEDVNFIGKGDGMIRLRANTNAKTTIIFKDCTFTNAGVILSGMNDACEIDVQFIGCTFTGTYKMYDKEGNVLTDPYGNIHYTSRLINANSNYLFGNILFDNCTLNYDASEYKYTNSNGAFEISGPSSSYGKTTTVTLKDVTINGKNIVPIKFTSTAYAKNITIVEEGTNTYTNNDVAVNYDGSTK